MTGFSELMIHILVQKMSENMLSNWGTKEFSSKILYKRA